MYVKTKKKCIEVGSTCCSFGPAAADQSLRMSSPASMALAATRHRPTPSLDTTSYVLASSCWSMVNDLGSALQNKTCRRQHKLILAILQEEERSTKECLSNLIIYFFFPYIMCVATFTLITHLIVCAFSSLLYRYICMCVCVRRYIYVLVYNLSLACYNR